MFIKKHVKDCSGNPFNVSSSEFMKLLKSKYILIEDSKRSLINLYREQIRRLKRKPDLVLNAFRIK
ncbi:MAG: hypothetical protein ACJA1D_000127 [Polaribacter sp.]|jgi:hypothetical protein